MKRLWKLSLIGVLGLLVIKCGESEEAPADTDPVDEVDVQQAFLNHLISLCDVELTGEATYPEENGDHPLVDTELRVHVETCEDDEVRLDLYRDYDTWHGTWVLSMREEGLHLYHDHAGDDGESDGPTGYGGYADPDRGSNFQQFFPADETTAAMDSAYETNEWMMEIDLENEQFIYYLERHSEPRFRAVMDMSDIMADAR